MNSRPSVIDRPSARPCASPATRSTATARSTCATPGPARSWPPCPAPPSTTCGAPSKVARDYKPTLTRYERYKIPMKAGELIAARLHEIARLITLESGLCLKDTVYEGGPRVGRAALRRAAGAGGRRPELQLRPHAPRQEPPRAHHARADAGRDQRHHALQPSAEPGDPQGGAVGGHQQPHGAQAHREDAAGRAAAGRRAVRSRAAAADAQRHHRRSGRRSPTRC